MATTSGGMLEWNVDGAAQGKPGRVGIGGILWDHTGDYHCVFSNPLGIRDSNEAEFIAIVFAIEISKDKE